MAALKWDETNKRLFETGVDHVILFPMNDDGTYGEGKAWNGVTGITENPDGADANDIYADNLKYLSLISKENWKATIKAYTYPIEFSDCQGEIQFNDGDDIDGVFFGQQDRQKFALAWRTLVGNDSQGTAYGYKLHIAYGLTAAPSEKDHATENESPEATEFSWELSSIPAVATASIPGFGVPDPVSHVVVESKNNTSKYNALEAMLNGGVSSDPTLPDIDTLIGMVA